MYFRLIAIDDQRVSEQEVSEFDQKLHELISAAGGQFVDPAETAHCCMTEDRLLRRILRYDETKRAVGNHIRLFTFDDDEAAEKARDSETTEKITRLLLENPNARMQLRRAVTDPVEVDDLSTGDPKNQYSF